MLKSLNILQVKFNVQASTIQVSLYLEIQNNYNNVKNDFTYVEQLNEISEILKVILMILMIKNTIS